jgi:hypothetical protein
MSVPVNTPSTSTAGAPRHLADDGDFVMVRLSVVDEVGFEAAILFGWLRFRCEINPDGYAATYADLMAETRLSDRQIRGAAKRLREAGWVATRRAAPYDPTTVWSIVWAGQHVNDETYVTSMTERTSREGSNRTSPPIKKVRNPPTPNADNLDQPRDIPPNPPQAGGACVRHTNGDGINCRGCGTTNRARERSHSQEALALRRAQDAEELRQARESKPDPEVATRGAAMARELLQAKRRAG